MRILRTRLTKPVSSSRAPTSSRKVVRGLAADTTERARISSPEASTTPTARPFSTTILRDRSAGADRQRRPFRQHRRSPRSPRPCRRRESPGRRARRRSRPSAGSRGRAARSASAARDGCRASRRRPAGPRSRSSEMLVEHVGDVHQQHAQEVAHVLLAEPPQRQPGQPEAGALRKRHAAEIGRPPRQQRLHDAGIADELSPQFLPGFRFARRCAVEAFAIGAGERSAVRRSPTARCSARRRTAANFSPWLARPSAEITSGCRRLSRCASDARKPGANSCVRPAPPSLGAASSTSTLRPLLRQHRRADEAVVAAADDDGIVVPGQMTSWAGLM